MSSQREDMSTPKRPFWGWYLIWAILTFLCQDLDLGSTRFLQITSFMRMIESKEIDDTFHDLLKYYDLRSDVRNSYQMAQIRSVAQIVSAAS